MEAIMSTITDNFGGPTRSFAKPAHQSDVEKDIPNLSDKVTVITGGSEDIGYTAGFVMLRKTLSKLFVISMIQKVIDGGLRDISEKLGRNKHKWPYGHNATWAAWATCAAL
jgi:hypothetical protein